MIGPFKGEYRWLSNFWVEPRRRGLTTEHFYQAEKTLIGAERAAIMRAAGPHEAKTLGSNVSLRYDWDQVRLSVMESHLRTKFYIDVELADRLVMTGDEAIVELNTWGDTFWGVCNGEGENHLGRLLMLIRDELHTYRELSG